jgi:hypothetical protein
MSLTQGLCLLLLAVGCAATVDTSAGDTSDQGGNVGSGAAGTSGSDVFGEDGLATTCEEMCGPIPVTAPDWCHELCDGYCDDFYSKYDPDQPCAREVGLMWKCVALELWHAGCPDDYDGCVEATTAYNDCLVALEQAGGGGTGP